MKNVAESTTTLFVLTSFRDDRGGPRSLALALAPFVHRTAAGYFRGFIRAPGFYLPLVISLGAMKHTRAHRLYILLERNQFPLRPLLVSSRLYKNLSAMSRAANESAPVMQEVWGGGGEGREEEEGYFKVCTLHYSPSLVKMASSPPPRKKIYSGGRRNLGETSSGILTLLSLSLIKATPWGVCLFPIFELN